jgi:hypothetical protein
MKDWAKYLMVGAAGLAAGIIYKNYQAEQAHQAALDTRRRRGTTGRITDLALQAGREVGLVPANNMNGMSGHMPMPQRAHGQRYAPQSSPTGPGFYGNSGMRQSGAGNPHAPVQVPARPRTVIPPPPAASPADNSDGEGSDYEQYGGDMMGGQRF